MPENIQHRQARSNKPRVHITYDVEIGDAKVQKEIPFVVGVLADLSGDKSPEIEYDDRKFAEVDRYNFNDFFGGKTGVKPELSLDNIESNLTKGSIKLTFKSIKDFHPDRLLENIIKSENKSEIADNLRKLVTIKELLSDYKENYTENETVSNVLNEMIEATVKSYENSSD